MRSVFRHLHAFAPALPLPARTEVVRASFGIAFGIATCTAIVLLMPGIHGIPLMLVAPLGATALLIFVVPNAPLAQPWSAVVGNMVSAVVAIIVIETTPAAVAPAIAVGGATLAMLLTRSLHPPGGAVALLVSLDPGPVAEAGLWFALAPVGLLTGALVAAGIFYNHATGRHYPFRQLDTTDAAPEPQTRLGLTNEELASLLQRFNQSANIGAADLARMLESAEREAAGHRFDGVTCAEIMSAGLISVNPDTSIAGIARKFREHRIKSLPVLDGSGRLQGMILQADIIEGLSNSRFSLGRRRHALRAADIMRAPGSAVPPDLPVGYLLSRLAGQGVEIVPVTNGDKLIGIITRSDIVNLLLAGSLQRQAA